MRLFCLFILACSLLPAQSGADREEWLKLFNGKDLSGWIPKIRGYEVGENFGKTFRVENGVIRTAYDAYDKFDERFGHLFYEREFSYYRLRAEYRFVGDQAPEGPGWARRNSGLMIHGQPVSTMLRDQNFPISIEVQLLGGLGEGERPTANLCTPGTHVVKDGKLLTRHCTSSTSKTYDGEQWVTSEVLALGPSRIVHLINGEKVFEYELPQIGGANVDPVNPWVKRDGEILHGGSISLQSESHPIEFRKVELLDLEGCMDEKATNYKSYFVKADNSRCRY